MRRPCLIWGQTAVGQNRGALAASESAAWFAHFVSCCSLLCVCFLPLVCGSYMHERGLGTSAPDFHLAKRFYDSCLATDGDAIVPVKLALAHLYARAWWEEYWSGSGSATTAAGKNAQQANAAAAAAASPAAASGSSAPSAAGSQSASSSSGALSSLWARLSSSLPAPPPFLSSWWARLRSAQTALELFLSLEDVILALLCAGLAIIVYVRSQR